MLTKLTVMRCVVSSCGVDSSCFTNRDITFHSFPKKQSVRTAWLKILSKEDWKPTKSSVVCSKHFLNEDQYMTRKGVCRIRAGAMPVLNMQNEYSHVRSMPCDVKVCRICFATNCNLYSMTMSKNLDRAYELVTGLSIENEANLPPYLCTECAQRLLNSFHFRMRSLRAHLVLLEAAKNNDCITLESINYIIATENSLSSNLAVIHNQTDHYDLEVEHTEEENVAEGDASDIITVYENNAVDSIKMEEDKINHNSHLGEETNNNYMVHLPDLQEHTVDLKMEEEIINQISHVNGDTNNDYFVHSLDLQEHNETDDINVEEDKVAHQIYRGEKGHNDNMMNLPDLKECTQVDDIYVEGNEVTQTIPLGKDRNNDYMVYIPDLHEHAMFSDIKMEEDDTSEVMNLDEETDNDDGLEGRQYILNNEDINNDIVQIPNIHVDAIVSDSCAEVGDIIVHNNLTGENTTNDGNVNFFPLNEDAIDDSESGKKEKETGESCSSAVDQKAQSKATELDVTKAVNDSSQKKLEADGNLINDNISCDICPYKTTSDLLMLSHLKAHAATKSFNCDVCHYITIQQHKLKLHNLTHIGEKPYSCDICNNKFSRKTSLMKHLKIYRDEKSYSCDVCKKEYSKINNLPKHLRKRYPDKPMKCNMCTKKICDKGALEICFNNYFGQKSYPSNVYREGISIKCNYNNNEQTHRRKHPAEKVYSCNYCRKTFEERQKLQKHAKHTSGKLYPCNVCKKSFCSKHTLKLHLQTHSNKKPHSYDVYKEQIGLKLATEQTVTWDPSKWMYSEWT